VPVPKTAEASAFALDTIIPMTEAAQEPLEQQLEEIGTQLAWVRDYL
jgi:hypothetical protein